MIVDQLGEQVFGIPPSLTTGLLTGLFGATAGVISLLVYFFFWEPNSYISPDWLIFVAIGVIIGFFLRVEQPLYRELYYYKTKPLRQAIDSGRNNGIQNGCKRKFDL
jgi:hypothetical protein